MMQKLRHRVGIERSAQNNPSRSVILQAFPKQSEDGFMHDVVKGSRCKYVNEFGQVGHSGKGSLVWEKTPSKVLLVKVS